MGSFHYEIWPEDGDKCYRGVIVDEPLESAVRILKALTENHYKIRPRKLVLYNNLESEVIYQEELLNEQPVKGANPVREELDGNS